MPIIVDTYNVLHVTGVLPPDLAGLNVRGLVSLLLESRYRGQNLTLVCDGTGGEGLPDGPTAGIRVVTSGAQRSADDLIAEMVDRSTDPRRLMVVSSDREVTRQARRRRCRVLAAGAFLHHLVEDHHAIGGPKARPKPAPPPPSRLRGGEVDRWLETFGAVPDTSETPVDRRNPKKRTPSPPSPDRNEKAPGPAPSPQEAAAFAALAAEANALVEADTAERARTDAEDRARAEADARAKIVASEVARRRDEARRHAERVRELPDDVQREAAALADAADDLKLPPMPSPTGPDAPIAKKRGDPMFPADLLAEAERMIREAED